jgi:hypothetical protein
MVQGHAQLHTGNRARFPIEAKLPLQQVSFPDLPQHEIATASQAMHLPKHWFRATKGIAHNSFWACRNSAALSISLKRQI